jgi:hypothetical protein
MSATLCLRSTCRARQARCFSAFVSAMAASFDYAFGYA